MKRKSLIVCILLAVMVLAAFCGYRVGLQKGNQTSRQEGKTLCVEALSQTQKWFESWKKTKNEEAYWRGVAEFCTFARIYEMMAQDNHIAVVEYYDFAAAMYSNADGCQGRMEDILAAIALLKEDLYDINTYRSFRTIRNALV